MSGLPQLVALWDKLVFWFKVPYASKYSPQLFSFPLFEHIQNVLLTNRAYVRMVSPENNSVVNSFKMCIAQGEDTLSVSIWYFNHSVTSD